MSEEETRRRLKREEVAYLALRAERATTNNSLKQDDLDYQINQQEKTLYGLGKQLKEIEQQQIRRALFSLDFKDQFESFQKIVEDDQHQAAAFLIYGEDDNYGQRFLVNRLLDRMSRSGTDAPFIRSVLFSSSLGTTDISQLWRQLGHDDGLKDAKKICEKLAKVLSEGRDVVLIYDGCEWLPKELIEEILKGLWTPLVQSMHTEADSDEQGHLFLFLLANGLGVDKLNFSQTLEDPCRPVQLPRIERFSDTLVVTWLSYLAQHLPPSFTRVVNRQTAQAIWAQHQGVPSLVLVALCERWCPNTDWDGVLMAWQT